MSAIEIIEQIKVLPKEERKLVDEFVMDSAARETESFETLVDRVFDKHPVLLQRLAQ